MLGSLPRRRSQRSDLQGMHHAKRYNPRPIPPANTSHLCHHPDACRNLNEPPAFEIQSTVILHPKTSDSAHQTDSKSRPRVALPHRPEACSHDRAQKSSARRAEHGECAPGPLWGIGFETRTTVRSRGAPRTGPHEGGALGGAHRTSTNASAIREDCEFLEDLRAATYDGARSTRLPH